MGLLFVIADSRSQPREASVGGESVVFAWLSARFFCFASRSTVPATVVLLYVVVSSGPTVPGSALPHREFQSPFDLRSKPHEASLVCDCMIVFWGMPPSRPMVLAGAILTPHPLLQIVVVRRKLVTS